MEVESVALARIRPYACNPRRNEAAVAKVAAYIEAFGFRQPIVVDTSYVVVAGHTRLEAAKRLGMVSVPVHVAAGLTEAQLRAYRLADNRSHEEAEWNMVRLAGELAALDASGFDLALTGFDADELAEILGKVGEADRDPDAAPPLPAAARSVTGDVWILGPHRVGCGDATDAGAVGLAMGAGLADAVWTDPPYNVAYTGKAGRIANDDLQPAEFLSFLQAAFVATSAVIKPGAPIYVAHADTNGSTLRRAFLDAGFKLSGVVITVGDRVLLVSGEAEVEELVPSVINEDRPTRSLEHPTMKPTALIERMLRNSARTGDLIFDPFAGSGSTLIAADRLGMSAVCMELDPCYCDVIVRRWQEYAGRAAHRERDGLAFDEAPEQSVARAT